MRPLPGVAAAQDLGDDHLATGAGDPELADAHWMLGEVAFWHDWDVDAAKVHIKDALELEPHHAGAIMSDAFFHMVSHRRREAIDRAAGAVHVDPLGMGTRGWFAACAFNVGENDLAMREFARIIAEQPSNVQAYQWRALTHLVAGDLQRARADLDASRAGAPPNHWGERNAALVASQEGNFVEVRRLRDDLVRRSTREWVSSLMIGQMEQALGDYDAAFDYYERAYQQREHLLVVLDADPTFRMVPPGHAPIIDDPRWASFVQRVGIAP